MKISSLAPQPSTRAARNQTETNVGDGFAGSTEPAPPWAELHKLQNRPSELSTRLNSIFARAATSPNPVISSLEPVIRNAQYVKLDLEKLKVRAGELTPEQLAPANWKFPHYIDEDSRRTIDFFMVANSINFLFFDPQSGDKYKTTFNGKEYSGADAMIAGIKRALQEGVPLLDADFLANVNRDQMAHLFRGNFELPLLDERTAIF